MTCKDCQYVCANIDYVLRQTALGSVLCSMEDLLCTNENNINRFINMPVTDRDAGVRCFVYAASSSTYGDHPVFSKTAAVFPLPLPEKSLMLRWPADNLCYRLVR